MFLDDKVIEIINNNTDHSKNGLYKVYSDVIHEFENFLTSQIKVGMSYKEFATLLDRCYNFELLIIKKLKKSDDIYVNTYAEVIKDTDYTRSYIKNDPHGLDMYKKGGGTLLLKNNK
jgi:hypothetical protein